MKGSKTSKFGTPKRISHDSSSYYDSKLYSEQDSQDEGEDKTKPDSIFPESYKNKIINKTAEDMSCLPDNCLHLMITSPPYNVTKEYDDDLTLGEYLSMLKKAFAETYRVLVHGGRACINVANLGRKPYIPLSDHISAMMIDIGYKMRGEIIWNKAAGAGISMAWGSFQSASNPVLRDVHEYIMIFSKGTYRRAKSVEKSNTISKEQFMDWTKSVWNINPVSAKKIGHPAPFPVELPFRLIQLYTFAGDIVLDPFMGSGSTAIAALDSERDYVGFETDEAYIELAKKRIGERAAK